MGIALKEAKRAFFKGEIPVGAVIVKNGKVIAKAYNKKETSFDPTSHAEINVIKKACKKLGNWRLDGCSIYVTVEPCLMCLGAIISSRIDKIIYGVSEKKMGAIESFYEKIDLSKYSKKIDIKSGVLEKECKSLLKEFFKSLRDNKN
jgi:tRNA(adenine34) deaminase